MSKTMALLLLLAAAFACGRAKIAPLVQDQSVCSEGAMKVYHKAGGPAGEGCVCARLASRDGANVATLKLLEPSGSEQILSSVSKGSGPGTWADTWSGAGCD